MNKQTMNDYKNYTTNQNGKGKGELMTRSKETPVNGSKITYSFTINNPHSGKVLMLRLLFFAIPSIYNGVKYINKYWVWSGGSATYKTYRDATRHYKLLDAGKV